MEMKKGYLEKLAKSKGIIFLARDLIYHNYKRCFSMEEAQNYIDGWGKTGYIEKYELQGDSYYFVEAYHYGDSKILGPVLGSQLYSKKVNLSHAHVILA